MCDKHTYAMRRCQRRKPLSGHIIIRHSAKRLDSSSACFILNMLFSFFPVRKGKSFSRRRLLYAFAHVGMPKTIHYVHSSNLLLVKSIVVCHTVIVAWSKYTSKYDKSQNSYIHLGRMELFLFAQSKWLNGVSNLFRRKPFQIENLFFPSVVLR